MEGASLLPDDDFDFDGALAAVPRIQTGFLQGIDRAIACAEDGLALFTDLGMVIGQAAMHNAIGDLSLAVGDPSRAGASYRVAAELARSIGEDAMLGPALNMLGLSQMPAAAAPYR